MSVWKIVYSEHAEKDLRDIYEYIAVSLLEPGIARNLTKRIMNAIAKLDQIPLRHRLFEKEPWHSKGLRVLPVDNYIVFYLPVDALKTVVVVRIMYGGRDIGEQLGGMDSQ
jgi:toxin ParE1/3/4